MRFLFLCHNFPEYGTYFRAFQLARHLVKEGHRAVLMLVSRDKAFRVRRYAREGVWIIECPNFQPLIVDKEDGWGVLDIGLRCIYGLTHRFDVVVGFGHKPDIAFPALLLKYLTGAVFVADWCDLWGEEGIFSARGLLDSRLRGTLLDRWLVRFEIFLERLVVRRAHGVTVICSALRERCSRWGIDPRRVLLMRSGCDIEGIRPMDRDAARRALGLPGGLLLEYLGNYHQEALFLAGAFERLAVLREDVRLLIVGPDWVSGPGVVPELLTPGLRRFWELPPAVKGRVIWAGKKPYAELPSYLAAADVLLLPMEDTALERGRWPNKISDYLASGRPIAATEVGDAGRFIKEEGCGITTPPDIETFCRAILAAAGDSALCARLGGRARAVAEGKLSWRSVTAGFLGFLGAIRRRRCM